MQHSIYVGHYITQCVRADGWYVYDDSFVRKTTLAEVLKNTERTCDTIFFSLRYYIFAN